MSLELDFYFSILIKKKPVVLQLLMRFSKIFCSSALLENHTNVLY